MRPLRLRTDDVVVVGRDRGPGIDYAAKVGCVSGVHCQFEMEGQRLYVTDLGSTNGTYVDGQELRCVLYKRFSPVHRFQHLIAWVPFN